MQIEKKDTKQKSILTILTAIGCQGLSERYLNAPFVLFTERIGSLGRGEQKEEVRSAMFTTILSRNESNVTSLLISI